METSCDYRYSLKIEKKMNLSRFFGFKVKFTLLRHLLLVPYFPWCLIKLFFRCGPNFSHVVWLRRQIWDLEIWKMLNLDLFFGFKAKYNLVRQLQLVLCFTYCLAKLLPRFSPNIGHVGKIWGQIWGPGVKKMKNLGLILGFRVKFGLLRHL